MPNSSRCSRSTDIAIRSEEGRPRLAGRPSLQFRSGMRGARPQAGDPGRWSGQAIRAGDPGRRSGQAIRAGNPGKQPGQTIRAGNPGRRFEQAIRAGNPSRQSGQAIRAGNPGRQPGLPIRTDDPLDGLFFASAMYTPIPYFRPLRGQRLRVPFRTARFRDAAGPGPLGAESASSGNGGCRESEAETILSGIERQPDGKWCFFREKHYLCRLSDDRIGRSDGSGILFPAYRSRTGQSEAGRRKGTGATQDRDRPGQTGTERRQDRKNRAERMAGHPFRALADRTRIGSRTGTKPLPETGFPCGSRTGFREYPRCRSPRPECRNAAGSAGHRPREGARSSHPAGIGHETIL